MTTQHAVGAATGYPVEITAAIAAVPKIVQGDTLEDMQALVEQADAVGRFLAKRGLTTSQIRNVFGTVRTIESTWRMARLAHGRTEEQTRITTETEARLGALRELALLKPRMAYAAGRDTKQAGQNKNHNVEQLVAVLTPAIDEVLKVGNQPELALRRFDNFLNFFEAILAYHVAAGGRTDKP